MSDCESHRGAVIRPPSEAGSYILQVTYGCSHNNCAFCATYLDRPFQTRPMGDVLEEIQRAGRRAPATRRVFLADGNALVLSTRRLLQILDALSAAFPGLQRVTSYANARDILHKQPEELVLLRERGLRIVYVGLESGSDEVLCRIDKGATANDMVDAAQRSQAAGIRISVIGLLGVGGPEFSSAHAIETGRVVSAMNPRFLSMLTVMLVPGTRLHQQWVDGEFQLMKPEALLHELRGVIEHTDGLSGCIFRTNHASNYLPLVGTLSKDKGRLLTTIDDALQRGQEALRPEYRRGL